ncbi:leucine-rich repeat-containing G-protein coupled receptor 4-like [Wyeomyia smithii]|uniref:leucine-rich repeat-containing G-protein coupled receptor 4-like n=1 Tax=Wyeomyia smithii TaxID=174621 RepID=UPI002467EAE3|nr:leucine-rich repeat-containing G-protein coupled receptor 4-like [Wyeomyia smithii]XP_055548313.1 leucine-rich repeat-containing G-protein coupled receptor 4-like [Wyeomyia smithii]
MKIWSLTVLALFCAGTSEAYLCMCSPNSCVLIHPNTDFFKQAESFCSTFRTAAHDISIIKLLDSELAPEAFIKFPNMTSLEIFQGHLAKFTSDTFHGAGKLTKLVIRGNALSALEEYSFKGADSMKDLMISANPLQTISVNAFANLQQLEILILAHGEIAALPANLFRNNRALKVISLNSNRIKSIDAEIFDGLDELAKLDLAENQLTAFDFKFLKAAVVVLNNNSLEHLAVNEHCNSVYANNNHIRTITVNGNNIAKLSLINNRIRDISNITKLTNLTSLSLGSNELAPDTVFSAFAAVEELMLQSTYINLTPDTFANLINLKILDLSYNNLTMVDFKIFGSQNSLQVLSYVGNQIKHFNYLEAREYLPRLRVLEICKNGWNNTYFENNVSRMKKFQISPDMHGFASHFLFRDEFINMCSEKLFVDYSYEDFAPIDSDIEDEINLSYTTTSTVATTTTVMSTSPVIPSTVDVSSTEKTREDNENQSSQQHHHIIEHNSNASVPVKEIVLLAPEKSASPFYVTFLVLVYILSAVGLISLVALAYLWRKRQLNVRHLTEFSTEASSDAVRLM